MRYTRVKHRTYRHPVLSSEGFFVFTRDRLSQCAKLGFEIFIFNFGILNIFNISLKGGRS